MGLSINAADFLHGLFVDRPPRVVDAVVELVSDKKPNASEATTRSPTVAVEQESNATANAVGEGVADCMNNAPVMADEFADWILRPDLDGHLGWEPPDLPETVRWWSRIRF